MEAKIVVGTKDGKSYNLEVKDDQAAVFIGKRIGDSVNLTPLGLKGYEATITGGSDKQGFPMRKDLHQAGRGKALMSTRTAGYNPKGEAVRLRKTVVGDIINDSISQINTSVVKEGKDPIPKLLGTDKAEAAEGEAPKEEKREDPVGPTREERKAAEQKAAEEPKADEKPEEAKAEEKPKEEAPKEDKSEEKPAEKPEAKDEKSEQKAEEKAVEKAE
jgi:small subunit ribosomal protein S6e